jgi:hypothetical protein
MGTSLFNTTPSATYPALIKVTDNTTLSTTLKTLSDGSGNDSALQLSTRRMGVLSDSSVTTQTSSVIQATTTNANLVIAPNGTGALIASIPDGTATGGNARGNYAVDLQLVRSNANHVSSGAGSFSSGGENRATGTYSTAMGNVSVASGNYSLAIGLTVTSSGVNSISLGNANTASSNYSTVSGGQSNIASTATHATVVGGQSNTSSGLHSISGGLTSTASGGRSVAFSASTASGQSSFAVGDVVTASGSKSIALGADSQATQLGAVAIGNVVSATAESSFASGNRSSAYLLGQNARANGFFVGSGDAQNSNLTARRAATLTTAGTTVLSLDGTGVTNLIIPTGQNRMWKVKVEYVGTITTITGTATGLIVGDTVYGEENFGFKKLAGTSTMGPIMNETQSSDNAIMDTCALVVTAGASQEMALTFTGPTFAGGGSVTMRVVAKVALVEVAF